MRLLISILVIIVANSCASGNQRSFTGSTPAGEVVRAFLGIPATDSIDFIRWTLAFKENSFVLNCRYGIGKPNTNGFINNGKTVEITGNYVNDATGYRLQHGKKELFLHEINGSLLHVLDNNRKMMVGNGGWSYTLNEIGGTPRNDARIMASASPSKDSISFEGRTPCIGLATPREMDQCLKLKWYIVLFVDPINKMPSTFRMRDVTLGRVTEGNGRWMMKKLPDGKDAYWLTRDAGGILYLVRLDENILVFTDSEGKLLVGNEDFSYTLNRIK